eukprot:4440341-Amphidinium_carterae.1
MDVDQQAELSAPAEHDPGVPDGSPVQQSPGPGVPDGPPLQQRLREQRRWIFQQRGTVPNRRPDDWPFAGHCFEA